MQGDLKQPYFAALFSGGKFTLYQPIILYRKFTADYLFDGYKILPAGTVLITDNYGKVLDMVPAGDAGDEIMTFTGLLSPGFINAHCHLELSHMKGHIPENTGLTDFILKVVFERNFGEDVILQAIEAAENEMLQNGTVAVGDICNNLLTIPQKSKQRLQYHNFIEASGFTTEVAEARFERSQGFYNDYSAAFSASSIVPHAPYSVSRKLFRMIDEFPDNRIITIHNQEAAAENELFKTKQGDFTGMYQKMNIDSSEFTPSGKTSLQTYLPWLQQYQSLILVHNVCTSNDDVAFEKRHTQNLLSPDQVQKKGKALPQSTDENNQRNHQPITAHHKPSTHYCLCPNANLYITGKLPDIDILVKNNCSIVLGTDSLASNHQLSIFEEIKTLQKYFPGVCLPEALQWATSNGAAALQKNELLGSFEKGKIPGIVHIDQLDGLLLTAAAVSKRIL